MQNFSLIRRPYILNNTYSSFSRTKNSLNLTNSGFLFLC